jgi:hypothetical protein
MRRCYGLTVTMSPRTRAQRRPIRARMRVFEHCEVCSAPCGGGTVTRSMRRVANATLLRFDRYERNLHLTMYAVPGQKRIQALRKILPWKAFRTIFLPSPWPAPLQHEPVSPARRLACGPVA